jgi:1-acyl-sn-glycerol-3-phosphate acyltransferase
VRRPEPWYRFALLTLRPAISLWFNWRFEGMENIPAEGPLLVACNHISYVDPLAHGLMLVRAGRLPRFLAKRELYADRFVRRALEGARHIPVDRGSGSMAPVLAAVKALKEGEAVIVYPEGTITRKEDWTPMHGKTGIARLALAAEVPVMPMAVWGSQSVWQRAGVRSLSFGRPVWVKAGIPLDFSEYQGRQEDPKALHAVADAVMEAITRLVQDLRGRYPKRWAPAGALETYGKKAGARARS